MSARDYWSTPGDFFRLIDSIFGPTLDVCANAENAKCKCYISETSNALLSTTAGERTWWRYWPTDTPSFRHHTAWMNPPYSNLTAWTETAKCQTRQPGFRVVALLPCDPSTTWFRDNVLSGCSQIFLLSPRIQFDVPEGIARSSNPWPSMLCVFEKSLVPAQILYWQWKRKSQFKTTLKTDNGEIEIPEVVG